MKITIWMNHAPGNLEIIQECISLLYQYIHYTVFKSF